MGGFKKAEYFQWALHYTQNNFPVYVWMELVWRWLTLALSILGIREKEVEKTSSPVLLYCMA